MSTVIKVYILQIIVRLVGFRGTGICQKSSPGQHSSASSERLLKSFDESHEKLSDCLEQIRDFLLVRGRVSASFTGSDTAFETLNAEFTGWIDNMRDETEKPASEKTD